MNMNRLEEKLKLIFLGIISVCLIILVVEVSSVASRKSMDVYIVGGRVDAEVSGDVSVDNIVDVNVQQVLGGMVGAHRSYTMNGREFWAIDVCSY